MTTYTTTAAFDKITDGIAESQGEWTSPDQAEEACNVYLLDPSLNEGDDFNGDRSELVAQVSQWMKTRNA